VERDLYTFAGATRVQGEVAGDVIARTGRLSVSPSARVAGDLRAHVSRDEQVSVAPGTVAGATRIILPEIEQPRSRFLRPGFYLWQLVRLGAAFVTGLVLFWLFPNWFQERVAALPDVLRALGVGFLILVATPVAVILVAVTLVGLPIALFSLVLWLAALYAAMIFVAAWLGQTLLHSDARTLKSFALPLLAGLAIVLALTAVPYLGFLVRGIVLLLGLGLLAKALQATRLRREDA
jgi:hypothetical protein